jgi:hypothetical protein
VNALASTSALVELDFHEYRLAMQVGLSRYLESASGMGKLHPRALVNWTDGASAECAFAKMLNIHWGATVWTSANNRLDPETEECGDVGEYQVKLQRVLPEDVLRSEPKMTLKPKDKTFRSQQKFVLAVGGCLKFMFVGWIYGYEAMTPDRWIASRGLWVIPQSAMYAIATVRQS